MHCLLCWIGAVCSREIFDWPATCDLAMIARKRLWMSEAPERVNLQPVDRRIGVEFVGRSMTLVDKKVKIRAQKIGSL